MMALSLDSLGQGRRRVEAWRGVEKRGVVMGSGVLRVLRRHGLETRLRRLSLVSGYAAPPQPERPLPPVNRHLEARQPGDISEERRVGIERRSWRSPEH